MLPDGCSFEVFPYRGKFAVMRKIGDRLRGYAERMPLQYRLVVIVDRDEDECAELKSMLEQYCKCTGLLSRSVVGSADWQVVTRIAVEELEAWYFGDWSAVRRACPRVSNKTSRAKHPTKTLTRSKGEPGRPSSEYCEDTAISGKACPRHRRLPTSESISTGRIVNLTVSKPSSRHQFFFASRLQ